MTISGHWFSGALVLSIKSPFLASHHHVTFHFAWPGKLLP